MTLLPGEEIKDISQQGFLTSSFSDEQINQKYIKGEVRIITEQARYPLSAIPGMLDGNDYSLNPEFQRRHRWNVTQKSKLIESFIMNVPIPPIFLYENEYSHYEVMDGLQRLTAINDFYKNKFMLEGLEEWPELNGKKYSELPTQIKKGIDRRYLSSIILLQETAKDEIEATKLKQLVFERINSGGVKLEPQESRNAIYNGKLNDLCIELARNNYLCKMWNIPLQTEKEIADKEVSNDLLNNVFYSKMTDVELVLRFFAYRQKTSQIDKSFKIFLDNYLQKGNRFEVDVIIGLRDIFSATIKFVYDLLGSNAFCLFRLRNGKWSWYNRPTTAIYDPLMLVCSEYLTQKDILLQKKDIVVKELENLYKNNYDDFEGRSTGASIVTLREKHFRSFFDALITTK
jgi:hypothetical protein